MISAHENAPGEWTVDTDLDPETVTAVGLEIFKAWVDFAMGKSDLGGKRIMHPTGRYASAIQFKKTGIARVAIIVNETTAPEAGILETGHKAIDLKQIAALQGRSLPMHRGQKGSYGSAGYGPPALGGGKRGAKMWAKSRAQGFTGFARVPTHITAENADSWIIPPMAAYSPSGFLVDMLRSRVEGM